MELKPEEIHRFVALALAEDIGQGDITTQATVPEELELTAVIATRDAIVVAGLPIAFEAFRQLAPDCTCTALVAEGAHAQAGTQLAQIKGPARALLTAERTALNILQLLSGIATLTYRYAREIEGTGATLLDTRKTLPGLRALSKYATHLGGATNHRMRLDDGVLIKDNHIAVNDNLTATIHACRAAGIGPIEVECDTLDQVSEALEAGADEILLDNMDVAAMTEAIAMIAGRVPAEASGGITLDTIRDIAETGVDFISVGRLTQSAPAADIGLDYESPSG